MSVFVLLFFIIRFLSFSFIFLIFFLLGIARSHQPFPRSLDCHAKLDFPRHCPSKPYHLSARPTIPPRPDSNVALFLQPRRHPPGRHVGKRILSACTAPLHPFTPPFFPFLLHFCRWAGSRPVLSCPVSPPHKPFFPWRLAPIRPRLVAHPPFVIHLP